MKLLWIDNKLKCRKLIFYKVAKYYNNRNCTLLAYVPDCDRVASGTSDFVPLCGFLFDSFCLDIQKHYLGCSFR